jgi:hypothetical protein
VTSHRDSGRKLCQNIAQYKKQITFSLLTKLFSCTHAVALDYPMDLYIKTYFSDRLIDKQVSHDAVDLFTRAKLVIDG